ncbi:methyltransferase, TIGR04325 family [Leptospira meyeri]|nr:methyltransferase, TIGR04325 family [Leptospira meyeri]PKA27065.1 methyltransferase, TIGR04325 family [Leptospira sp. mixed culture ATI2-C-A1]TGM71582.1 methyltransferase, TIGR04325 family [Leptospira meyeri]
MKYAPIIIFVYNRPDHTKRVIDSLIANEEASESDLIIYSDFAKAETHLMKVNEVRSYLKEIKGFKSVRIVERTENYGLAKSIISGVSEVIEQSGSVIVLEDDILVSPYFLRFMNSGLEKYKEEEKVASIHGYSYPIDTNGLDDTFFIRGADCWGWATWRRAWQYFEPDGEKLRDQLIREDLVARFDYDYTYPFFQMLTDQILGRNNSWAIRWHASIFLKNKLTLYPKESLILNIGLDNSGTHCDDNDYLSKEFSLKSNHEFPKVIQENLEARNRMVNYFRSISKHQNPTLDSRFSRVAARLLRFAKRIIKRLFGFLWNKERKVEITFTGNYATWDEASTICSGYDSDIIINKVKKSLELVRDGKAIYERDSVIFDNIEYSQPLLVGLLFASALNGGKLKVLDFGGSLGSSYFQNRKFLSKLPLVEWSIVEQEKMVSIGKLEFENKELRFFHTIDEVVKNRQPETVILSSVLPYIKNPYEVLALIKSFNFETIIVDRTPFFIKDLPDRITIETVPPEIYIAKYPAWFFNYKTFLDFLSDKYELVESFESNDHYSLVDAEIIYRALIFKRKI